MFFEPLSRSHARSRFDCGIASLNLYFSTQALQDQRKHMATTTVATPDHQEAAGFYSLCQSSVGLTALPDALATRLTRQPVVPATLIARLARDLRFRGQRVGELLLIDALRTIARTGAEVASALVVVDAINPEAAAFYQRFGFLPFESAPKRLYLPFARIAQQIGGE